VLGLFAVRRSRLTTRFLTALRSFSTTPLFQVALLLLVGVSLLAGQATSLDRASAPSPHDFSEGRLDESEVVLVPSSQRAYTDAGQPISLWCIDPGSLPETGEAAFFRDNPSLQHRVTRTAAADPGYNCHGWVFTGGRAWLRGVSVPAILSANGYVLVEQPR